MDVQQIIAGLNPRDVASIEQAVKDCGLFPFLDAHRREFPALLYPHCGRGIGIWQYPSQFAPYLHDVGRRSIDVYAEIGVAAGGTYMFTSEFLARHSGLRRSYAADVAPAGQLNSYRGPSPFDGNLQRYLAARPRQRTFVHGDAQALRALLDERREYVDLLLIDGDHSYAGVRRDFETLHERASIIVLHDIVNRAVPGVGQFWRELKATGRYDCREFVDQYPGVDGSFLGIGVLSRK